MPKTSLKKLASARLYKIARAEKVEADAKAWYERNRPVILEKARAYYVQHAEKRRAYASEWAKQNAARVTANRKARLARKLAEDPDYNRKQYAKHAERQRAYTKAYKLAHPDKNLSYEAMRRAAKRAPGAEKVDVAVLYVRDKKTCTLCHAYVKRREWSIDHIVPLAHGGQHTYRNTALAHKLCNIRKRDSVVTQQLPMF